MIRNHLYSFFGEDDGPRRETVHTNLETLRIQLREDRRQSNALDYMRCYLQCRFGFLPRDRLYREMKAKIATDSCTLPPSPPADYVFGLVEDLSRREQIEIFHTISTPSEKDFLIEQFLKDTRGNPRRNLFVLLTELKTYKITQPIVLALLNRYVKEASGSERKRVANFVHRRLTLLTSFVMRTAFVAPKFESSHFESAFSNLAEEIMSADDIESIRFQTVLQDVDEYRIFDNAAFVASTTQINIRDNAKAKRFLMGLAYNEQSDLSILNDRKYTIEHILSEIR